MIQKRLRPVGNRALRKRIIFQKNSTMQLEHETIDAEWAPPRSRTRAHRHMVTG
jgi:hypothetical protein